MIYIIVIFIMIVVLCVIVFKTIPHGTIEISEGTVYFNGTSIKIKAQQIDFRGFKIYIVYDLVTKRVKALPFKSTQPRFIKMFEITNNL